MSTEHNPDGLTPSQYGSQDNWRLLREDELKCLPKDAERKSKRTGNWVKSVMRGEHGMEGITYRTRQPLPGGGV